MSPFVDILCETSGMVIRTPSDLGAVIRDRRRRLGMDQRSLADRAGVSRQWVVEVERGKPRAEIGLLLRTLNVLGVTLAADGPPPGDVDLVPEVDLDAAVDAARAKPKR